MKQYAEKAGVRLPVNKVFGQGYGRCPHCKRGRIWTWDKSCKVCSATIMKVSEGS